MSSRGSSAAGGLVLEELHERLAGKALGAGTRQELEQVALAEDVVRRAGVGEPVGVEEHRVPRIEHGPRGGEVDLRAHAEQRARHRQLLGPSAGSEHERRRMAAGGHVELQPISSLGRHRERGGEEAIGRRGAVAQRGAVEPAQHCRRVEAGHRADRVAGQRGERRRARPLAAHVSDRDPPAAGVDRERVVEVAADLLALTGGTIAPGDPHSWDVRKAGGSRLSWSVRARRRVASNSRELSIASPARRASSSQSTRSSASKGAPSSMRSSERAPSTRWRAISGTTIAEW